MTKTITAMVLSAFGLIVGMRSSGQNAFQNLDFESASVPTLGPGEYGYVPFGGAFPGWTGFFGTNQATQVLENNATLGAHNISILGPNSFIPAIEGNYSALLQAGLDNSGAGPVPASIAQTGLVPSTAMSIEMKVETNYNNHLQGLVVTLGGQTIPMVSISGTTNYTLVAGDVSAFAGQTAQLQITASFVNTYGNYTIEVDSIAFSSSAIPEPKA